jgi:hypothetical protein
MNTQDKLEAQVKESVEPVNKTILLERNGLLLENMALKAQIADMNKAAYGLAASLVAINCQYVKGCELISRPLAMDLIVKWRNAMNRVERDAAMIQTYMSKEKDK